MAHRPVLGLVPLDQVDLAILHHLRKAIADLLRLSVQILPPKPLPSYTHHIGRNQYHSTQLLEYLLDDDNPGPFRLLGITAVDLYIPIFTFVFGEAQLDGKAAIISTFRPGGGADSFRPPREIFWRRLLQLSAHELGHTFGLAHCRQPGCLMNFSANLEKLDQKHLKFCEYCQILLGDYFNGAGP